MDLSKIPAGSRCLDVDGVPVILAPDGHSCEAFRLHNAGSYPYPNVAKARTEGDEMMPEAFALWVRTGRSQFA